jgi:glycosidase
MKFFYRCVLPLITVFLWLLSDAPSLRAEAMIQYFNTSWNEITAKMPELAEAGYDSIWIPPPTKGSGGLSVGYDLFDPFDLGSKDQEGTVATFYGTEADLLRLVETAHRFGIRVYLDNVMNHRAFTVPGYDATTPIDYYPGLLPEDFHLQSIAGGFYRNWPGISDYSNQFQVWNLSTSSLMDVAQEPGTTNLNFGATEGSTHPKIFFVRQPNNPEYYCYKPDGTYVGFGTNNGITTAMLAANPGFYGEYTQDFLSRAARWELDRTHADGLRLDAVKHVRDDFFGAEYGSDKNSSTYGYLGQISQQYMITHGFTDTDYRHATFNTEIPRTDAMYFGEHLGGTPQQPYIDAGMRLLDNSLNSTLNNVLATGPLNGLDSDGGGGLSGGSSVEVGYAQSADNGYAEKRQLQHAFLLTRAGLPVVYTDGNHHAGTLGAIGTAFPANAYTNYLGQFGDNRLPNLLYIHNQFARSVQIPKWSDQNVLAFERQDKRENSSMTDADGTTLLFMMNCDSSNGEGGRPIQTTFPAGSYLYQYATGAADNGDQMTNFYYTVPSNQQVSDLVIPKGGYFAFSWRTPEMPTVNASTPAITILQNGAATSTLTYTRKDGPDGDPAFNPYNLPDANTTDYAYSYTVPCVTDGSNLSFLARSDGSAENILMELDGGVDINSQMKLGPQSGELRDNPPGAATDVFLGYEQMQFVQRTCEKFAAEDTSRDVIGSLGSETYQATIGTAGFAVNDGSGTNSSLGTAAYAYHNPTAVALDGQSGATLQFYPAPESASGVPVNVWLKTGYEGLVNQSFLYYTTDGLTYPEGSGGIAGNAATSVVPLTYQQHGNNDGSNVTDWWKGTLPAMPGGTVLRYKIGTFLSTAASVFPADAGSVALKKLMETRFQITNFNATTANIYTHDDYGPNVTGLSEGFHVLRTRQFLNRAGRASIYNTSVQTFYYDAQPPAGAVVYPNENDTLNESTYGVVVRTDPTVTEVWYKILDGDPTNDDSATTANNGNGTWVQATELTATPAITSPYPNEWRFNYVNIPASGTAKILVRLRELTSSPMSAADTSTDSSTDTANHWTTLIRDVNTAGPVTRMFVSYPTTDGTVVDSNYVMKVWFSKSLANNSSTADLLSRFVIKIASTASGSPNNGVVQGQANYQINYNVTNDYDELAYQLPNLYNGSPDFLHTIDVTYTQAGAPTLEAFRLVKAAPIVAITDNIVNPPEFDNDGLPYIITLADVANPTPAQRSTNIEVQTDASATNVALTFTSGSGTTTLNSGSPTVNGTSKVWDFTWSNIAPGSYTFTSTVTTPNGTATATRDATVIFRQVVTPVAGKLDNDDDGIPDDIETTQVALPTTDSETWTNDQVHRYMISGKTNPLSPDTDGDGLPDGLELGLTAPLADPSQTADTNTSTDTNGDGIPNFVADFDPPLYNTTDNTNAPSGQDYSYYGTWPFNLNNARTDQIAGTMTDPTKPDTDGDGLNDGVEDLTFLPRTNSNGTPILDVNGHATYQAFHNGRVDIIPTSATTTQTVIAHPPTIYNTSVVDRTRLLSVSPNAQYLETDPNNSDTDGDGLTDGQEDLNHNGIVDLAIIDRNRTDSGGNYVVLATFSSPTQLVTVQGSTSTYPSSSGTAPSPATFYYLDFCYPYLEPVNGKTYVSTCLDKTRLNNIFRPNGGFRPDGLDIVWLETDPRRMSTSGDGLPDGWKEKYGLDPFDDGVIGHYNLHTGKLITNTNNGPNGDPYGAGLTNLQAYINGKDPTVSQTAAPPPTGSITVGPKPISAQVTVGAVTNDKAMTDWTEKDLIALGYYDGAGPNYNGSDVYHAYDGYDSSRNLVAFYAHDGGAVSAGGDGNFYFRVDLDDLKPYAEQGNLDIYVAINVGNPGSGEHQLPDGIFTLTNMGWQVVVGCYQTNQGTVYVDTNPLVNTTGLGQNLSDSQYGVVARDQNTPNGFEKAYFDSSLSAAVFSISRQALLDAGWDGRDASNLIYQVYTTKDGVQPGGAGNIPGRSAIRCCLYNDYIASDYYADQASISGVNSILRNWCGLKSGNDNGKRAKVISLVHGNQAIQPGSVTQNLINNNAGAGYYRPLDVHTAYGVPLTMHITPTLASSIQWASVSPSVNEPYLDGPALNANIASMASSGLVDLLGSTFSDHIMLYFDQALNSDNVALANEFLTDIYKTPPSSQVFWTPERVSNADVLSKVGGMGFGYTFIDQMRHVEQWFGRTSALSTDGNRINRINGQNCFVINDGNGGYMFQNDDNGLPVLMREALLTMARSSQQDQMMVLMNNWEDFGTKTNADAYDQNIRWLASHPWTPIVTPDQVVKGQVDTSVPPTGTATTFGYVDRGTGLTPVQTAQDYVDHATEENYDNWYNGSSLEESLSGKTFTIRSGVPVSEPFGSESGLSATGIAKDAWADVLSMSTGDSSIKLARGVYHASLFETAFHNNTNNDLDKFSTGAYVYPDTTYMTLADFANMSQAQTHESAILARVNTWSTAAAAGGYLAGAVAEQADIDLDGEQKYLLYNDRLFAVFDRIGGRMTGAWIRDLDTNQVFQVAGNYLSYPNSFDETEGNSNVANGVIAAYRTSGFKDWYAIGSGGTGTNMYVNNVYTATAATTGTGWTFTSSDGNISKTITLGALQTQLEASYALSGGLTQLYVRCGLSPNLYDLLVKGQAGMTGPVLDSDSGGVNVFDTNSISTVRDYIRFSDSTHNATYNTAATDGGTGVTLTTVNMRNQAQTQQVEIFGGTSMKFALGFQTGATNTYSSAGDGIPDWWKIKYGLGTGAPENINGPTGDPDGDGRNNLTEYLFGTNPTAADVGVQLTMTRDSSGNMIVTFPTIRDRIYDLQYTNTLGTAFQTIGGDFIGTGGVITYVDNGSQTGTSPSIAPHRFYRLQVRLP